MRVEVVDRRPVSRRITDGLRWRIQQSLARLDGPVQKVTVTLDDANGPRGGVDQNCQLVIEMDHQPALIIRERAESVQQATGMAIARARRSLARRLQKLRRHRRRSTFNEQAVFEA
jgi:ribosome-associated translation inhibitor RaiA